MEADFYPVFGGAVQGIPVADAVKAMAQNVTGIKVPLSGHWIPEEAAKFYIKNSLPISLVVILSLLTLSLDNRTRFGHFEN